MSKNFCTLSELAADKKNAIVDGPFGSNLKTSDYVDSGVPVLQGKNITGNTFSFSDIRFIKPEKAEELIRSSVRIGDILMIKIGSIGYAAIIDDLGENEYAIIPANLAKITPDHDKVISKYLLYCLTSQDTVRYLNKVASKTAQPALSLQKIKSIKIPLPPLETQKKIAEILDAADTLRQKTKTLIEKYDQLTQSLFLAMFGDPVVNNKKLPTIKLGELGKWQSGGTPSRQKPDYFNGDIPWLSSGELNTMFSADSKEHISSFAINESSAKIIAPGSLLLGMYDTAALKSTINQVPLSCNQAIAYCKIDKEIANTIYIYCIIQIGREHYRRLQRGVRQKNLNLSMISNIEILFPPISLQNQFAKRVQAIEEQKVKAQESLEKSEELFQSLLQRAFNGKLV